MVTTETRCSQQGPKVVEFTNIIDVLPEISNKWERNGPLPPGSTQQAEHGRR